MSKLIELVWALKKKLTKAGCTEDIMMTSQLKHNFQAVHGADDITTLNLQSQAKSMSVSATQVEAHIY